MNPGISSAKIAGNINILFPLAKLMEPNILNAMNHTNSSTIITWPSIANPTSKLTHQSSKLQKELYTLITSSVSIAKKITKQVVPHVHSKSIASTMNGITRNHKSSKKLEPT